MLPLLPAAPQWKGTSAHAAMQQCMYREWWASVGWPTSKTALWPQPGGTQMPLYFYCRCRMLVHICAEYLLLCRWIRVTIHGQRDAVSHSRWSSSVGYIDNCYSTRLTYELVICSPLSCSSRRENQQQQRKWGEAKQQPFKMLFLQELVKKTLLVIELFTTAYSPTMSFLLRRCRSKSRTSM